MKRISRLFAVCFFVLFSILTISAAFAAETVPPENPKISAALQPYIDSHELAGMIAMVGNKDEVTSLNIVGFADIEAGRKMAETDFFWIASMSKGVTGVAVMMLVDEGKISLDDPVTKYIPELAKWKVVAEKDGERIVLDKPSKTPTIRELLCHTSGTAFLSEIQNKAGLDAVSLQIAALPSVTGPLEFQPGESHLYSNQGINIAGRVVEIASGMAFAEFLQKRIFDPLEMTDTTFWPSEEQLERLAKTYRKNAKADGLEVVPISYFKQPLNDRNGRHAEPGGGLFSTTGDIFKFCRMLANDGQWNGKRYLSEAAMKELRIDQTGKLKRNYSLGWETAGETIGHGGAHGTKMTIAADGTITIFMVQGVGDVIWKANNTFQEALR